MGLLALNELICVESSLRATFLGLSFTALDKGSVCRLLAESRSRYVHSPHAGVYLLALSSCPSSAYLHPLLAVRIHTWDGGPCLLDLPDQIFKITLIRNLIHFIIFSKGKEMVLVVTGKRSLSMYSPMDNN